MDDTPKKAIPARDRDKAFALVGRFMFRWAGLENEIKLQIQKLAKFQTLESEIILANASFREKVDMLMTLVDLTFLTTKNQEERARIRRGFRKLHQFASDYRNLLAHNAFYPVAGGAIRFAMVKAKGELKIPDITWDEAFFMDR